MGNYVYINSELNLWTVGFYSPDGRWHSDSNHDSQQKAAKRVSWLNGSRPTISQKDGLPYKKGLWCEIESSVFCQEQFCSECEIYRRHKREVL